MKTKELEKKSFGLTTTQADFSNIPVELREAAAYQLYMEQNPLKLPDFKINVLEILRKGNQNQEAKICK